MIGISVFIFMIFLGGAIGYGIYRARRHFNDFDKL